MGGCSVRTAQDPREEVAPRGLLALAHRTLLRRSQGRGRADALGGARVGGAGATPDAQRSELPVPGDRLPTAAGKKIRS